MRALVATIAAAAMTAGAVPEGTPVPAGREGAPGRPAMTRSPGFAAALAERPLETGSAAWPAIGEAAAWRGLVAGGERGGQAARWAYARGLIARQRGDAALGVLEVMASDDPDLAIVPAWRRARGAALTLLRRPAAALAALADERLIDDPEACLWRMRALALDDLGREALAQLGCAMPALRARPAGAWRPYLLAAAGAAVEVRRHRAALAWLAVLPRDDPAANLLRGRALLATGDAAQARARLARTIVRGNPEERVDARLTLIEGGVAARTLAPAVALRRLDDLRFGWRGGAIERRALFLSLRLATATGNQAAALAAGAVLFRYGDLGTQTAPLVATLQATLVAALAPGTGVTLARGAGLFWDYRDIIPTGAEGDRLVELLAARLQTAGLYERAADLLQHRLTARAEDLEKGPLSVRVASLYILAGLPARAIGVLRDTDAIAYPPAMRDDRRLIEAAALDLLGKPAEALASIQDVADAAGLRAEIYWRARDWHRLVELAAPSLPRAGALSEVAQAVILRHAIALAMLGREPALAALNARYARAFAPLPTGPTFAMLTARMGAVEPGSLGRAMAALPSASPAGRIGDLIAAGDAAMEQRPD